MFNLGRTKKLKQEISTLEERLALSMRKNVDHLIEIRELTQALKEAKAKKWIPSEVPFRALDPAPTDQAERRGYVARVVGTFHDWLKSRLEFMITEQKNELARYGLTPREEEFLRAGINFGSLLLDYGERASIEHMANLQEAVEKTRETEAEQRLRGLVD